MKILIASSEVVPFAKTGGLADVCGSLPGQLSALGHDVSVIMPAHRSVYAAGPEITPTDCELRIDVGKQTVEGRLAKSALPDSGVPVFLVEQSKYFDRPQLYGEAGTDYEDNCERFVFFCRAVLQAAEKLAWEPDVIHCNDWQTGLIPAYLKIGTDYPALANVASLMTIHNLAYQGIFWHWDMLLTGLDWKYFNWKQLEFYGKLNLLKSGIVFADALNTVSETYAKEIQQPELGCGLDGILRHRQNVLTGIVNGIDTNDWNPEVDDHLPQQYSIADWQTGKAVCKQALQHEVEIEVDAQRPLIGVVGRLATQKGWSLILEVMRHWLDHVDVSWVVLGAGDPEFESSLAALRKKYPDRLGLRMELNNGLAHRIEAGADLFLMPSQYEPCGLNQLYSLKYGTIPVVRDTGGLSDTIVDATPETIAAGRATGFKFGPFLPESMESALARAVQTFLNEPDSWASIVETAMRQDWSWTESARKYEALYQTLIRGGATRSQPV